MSFRGAAGYIGSFRCGKPHGRGRFSATSGEVYDGEWSDGKKHGFGTYHYNDGSVYEGEFKSDKRHGKGKFVFHNGDVYEGSWYLDRAHGRGTYTYAGGGVYVDNWINGTSSGNAHRNIRKLRRGDGATSEFVAGAVVVEHPSSTKKKVRPKTAPASRTSKDGFKQHALNIHTDGPETDVCDSTNFRLSLKDMNLSALGITSPIKPKPKAESNATSSPTGGRVFPDSLEGTRKKGPLSPSKFRNPATKPTFLTLLFDPRRVIHNNTFNTSMFSGSRPKPAFLHQVTT
jgi:hypothetical protein